MNDDDQRRAEAIQRLEDKRSFKTHAVVYVAVNALLIVIWAASGGGYFWPVWVIGGWGIGLLSHAWKTYGERPLTEEEIRKETKRHAA